MMPGRAAVALFAGLGLVATAACSGDDDTSEPVPSSTIVDVPDDAATDDAATDDDAAADDGDGAEMAPDTTETAPTLPEGYEFDGALVSTWAPDAAAGIERGDDNTMPLIVQESLQPVVDDHWIWDSWPLRSTDGDVAEFEGWTIVFGLSAEIVDDRVPGDRHGLASWRMLGSQTGLGDDAQWVDLGPVWAAGDAVGARQWAGSAVLDPATDRVTLYYTALGDLPAGDELTGGPASDPYEDVNWTGGSNLSTSSGPDRQEMVAVSAELTSDADGRPTLADMGEHEIILTADGAIYRTAEQASDLDAPYVFRDPWWFRDDDSGREYLLFSASPAFLTGDAAGGLVGLAMKDDSGTWVPLQPVLASPGVNNQLERPHLVHDDGLTYLFVSTHGFSFLDGIDGPPGLYGFVSDGLGSDFRVLNGTGLVMANPAGEEQQAYSWVVLPSSEVLSFANYFDLEAVGGLSGISGQSVEWQREHFAGTLAPLVQLELDGASTDVLGS